MSLMEMTSKVTINDEQSPGNVVHFPTFTTYDGTFDNPRHLMFGNGLYKFPDGSTYYGQFKRGHFHGLGTMSLPAPHKMEIRGEFKKGRLVKLIKMEFEDTLQMYGDMKGDFINFAKWEYCSAFDRRFLIEYLNGIRPTGPTTYLTAHPTARKLTATQYDVEEGVYDMSTGNITRRKSPFTRFYYIACPEHVHWICKTCRSGGELMDCSRNYTKFIMKANNAEEEPLYAHVDKCICEFPFEKKFTRLNCKRCEKPPKNDSDDNLSFILQSEEEEVSAADEENDMTPSPKVSEKISVLMRTSELISESDLQTKSESNLDPNVERMRNLCSNIHPFYEEISHFNFPSCKGKSTNLTTTL